MTIASRPTTPPQLSLYRSRHVITRRVRDGALEDVCDIDGIRVIQRRSGQRPLLYRHDPDEIRRLAAIERGES